MSHDHYPHRDRPPYPLNQPSHPQQRRQSHLRRHSGSDFDSRDSLNSRYHPQPYPQQQFRRPRWQQRPPQQSLIENVTNEWKYHTEKFSSSNHDDYDDDDEESRYYRREDEDDCISDCRSSFLCSRRVRRYLCLYFIFLIGSMCYWTFYLKPEWTEKTSLDQSLARLGPNQGYFSNARPHFAGMTQLARLDERFLPAPGDKRGSIGKRLVFVGDVHGCKKELMELLEKVGFNEDNDHLVLTGDILYKGPDSAGVIDYARKVGASCVRGNHEDRVLLATTSTSNSVMPNEETKEFISLEEVGSESSKKKGRMNHEQLARSLTSDQLAYLRRCPIILQIGQVANKNYVVVHAGLVPGVSFERQDPFHVMNMRTIDLISRVPTELRSGEQWDKVWNHYQKKKVPAHERVTVIYGHDAKKGLTIRDYTKGLDSSCVAGGKLSALVVDDQGNETIFSVKCHEDYVKKSKSDD